MKRGNPDETLAKLFPEIAREWDYEKNDFVPEDIWAYSSQYAYFICPKGHSYYKSIINPYLHSVD